MIPSRLEEEACDGTRGMAVAFETNRVLIYAMLLDAPQSSRRSLLERPKIHCSSPRAAKLILVPARPVERRGFQAAKVPGSRTDEGARRDAQGRNGIHLDHHI